MKVAILGFGTVGVGVYEMLENDKGIYFREFMKNRKEVR